LDDANTIRFAQIISSLSQQAQFVTITHNRETMAHANMLYGVTMGDDGVSKLLSVKLEQAKAFAK
jgi:chromosome segregation protein